MLPPRAWRTLWTAPYNKCFCTTWGREIIYHNDDGGHDDDGGGHNDSGVGEDDDDNDGGDNYDDYDVDDRGGVGSGDDDNGGDGGRLREQIMGSEAHCTLEWNEINKMWRFEKTYDRKLLNGRYSKTHEKLLKNISVFRPHWRAKI